jgi:hypothetical protein
MDIKYRKLDKKGIDELLNSPGIEKNFVGSEYKNKVSRKQWTEDYLDILSYAAETQCFNRDYLYYLNEVAEYVNKKKKKSKIVKITLIVGGVVLFALAIFLLVTLLNKNKDNGQKLDENRDSSVKLECNKEMGLVCNEEICDVDLL